MEAKLGSFQQGIIESVVLAVNYTGESCEVYILDKCQFRSIDTTVDRYLCLCSNGSTFYTDNIKEYFTKEKQELLMKKFFNKFIQ